MEGIRTYFSHLVPFPPYIVQSAACGLQLSMYVGKK